MYDNAASSQSVHVKIKLRDCCAFLHLFVYTRVHASVMKVAPKIKIEQFFFFYITKSAKCVAGENGNKDFFFFTS